MSADDLMDDFPATPDRLVTLANWRKPPFSAWGFRNVRRLIPSTNIAASGHPANLEMSLEEIGRVGFIGHDGHPTTVKQALGGTCTDAFVVLRRGRIAAEWYDNGMDATTPHIVFSVSKSICGTLGGILADRGLLDPMTASSITSPSLPRQSMPAARSGISSTWRSALPSSKTTKTPRAM